MQHLFATVTIGVSHFRSLSLYIRYRKAEHALKMRAALVVVREYRRIASHGRSCERRFADAYPRARRFIIADETCYEGEDILTGHSITSIDEAATSPTILSATVIENDVRLRASAAAATASGAL